jgi:hypothetical protein
VLVLLLDFLGGRFVGEGFFGFYDLVHLRSIE